MNKIIKEQSKKNNIIQNLVHYSYYFFILLVFILILSYSRSDCSEGRTLFENKCLQCHRAGGEANKIAPSMNATKQWNRFFKKKKHNRRYKDISSLFSSVELDSVKSYLIEHAADSPKPQAFGLK